MKGLSTIQEAAWQNQALPPNRSFNPAAPRRPAARPLSRRLAWFVRSQLRGHDPGGILGH